MTMLATGNLPIAAGRLKRGWEDVRRPSETHIDNMFVGPPPRGKPKAHGASSAGAALLQSLADITGPRTG